MTNPDELERAVERLTADLTEPFGHFAGEAPESCALVRIEDARLILSANREMRTALEPFVQTANQCPANWPDEARPGVINLGHCRKARSALSTKEQPDV